MTRRESLPDSERSSPGPLVEFLSEHGIILGGGGVPGPNRCSAIGLKVGDCTQQHLPDSRYCYYHQKVLDEDITFFFRTTSTGAMVEASPRDAYPVWPLPKGGYLFIESKEG